MRWIERHAAGVQVIAAAGSEPFDKLILAAHSDQSLALLSQPTLAEREVLGAIRYQSNRAVLHTDTSVLPKKKLAWAAWNYERAHLGGSAAPGVCCITCSTCCSRYRSCSRWSMAQAVLPNQVR